MKALKAALPLLILAVLACGCTAGRSVRAALAQAGAVDSKAGLVASVQIRYLARSEGTNYCITQLDSGDERIQQLYECLQKGMPAGDLPERPYSPEARSDIQILVQGQNGTVVLYYESAADIVSYRNEGVDKDGGTRVEYECFTPGSGFQELLQSMEQESSLQDAASATAFCTMDELKAQLDKGKLDVSTSQEIETQEPPADFSPEGTCCRIYDSTMNSSIPADKLIFCALYADAEGQSAKYSVLGVYVNDTYTIVQLDIPHEDGGEKNENEEEPAQDGPCSVMIDRSAVDLNHWIVYMDTDNIVKGIVIPGEWGLTE